MPNHQPVVKFFHMKIVDNNLFPFYNPTKCRGSIKGNVRGRAMEIDTIIKVLACL